jgi:hypothetical protein
MYRLALHSPLRGWNKGEFPISPFVYLSLGYRSEDNGHTLLSARLMRDSEIDEAVDQLKGELEEFRKKAKEELKSLQQKC